MIARTRFGTRTAFVAAFFVTLCAGEPHVLHAAAGDTSSHSTIISVSASFCDADLFCDPEENYESCPSDCEAPPEPTPTTTPNDDGRTRRPTGYRTRVEQGGIIYIDDIEKDIVVPGVDPIVEFVEDLVSPDVSSEPDPRITDPVLGLFSSTLRVSINPVSDEVTFSWVVPGRMVRVLRDESAFPSGPLDGGLVVYEGERNGFVDRDVHPGRTYYYSIFVRNAAGEYAYRERVVVTTNERTAYIVDQRDVRGFGFYPRGIFQILGILLLLIAAWRLFTRSLAR